MTKLREWIKAKHLTQREFASLIGFHEVYVSRIINGYEPMTSGFKGAFVEAFGTEEYDRVFGNGCVAEQQS